jgi:predicted alpha/beta hydrolase
LKEPTTQPFTLLSADGTRLAATWYPVAGGRPAQATLVVAAATGVPQSFYRRFALFASRQQQVQVLSFDYRGTAASRPMRLRGFQADFSHWAQDIDAALAEGLRRAQGGALSYLGHSIGGTLGPLAARAVHAQSMVLVGAQTAYWRDWPALQRWPMALLWHGFMPAMTLLCGHFPARRLRLGEDLPRGVALQWAARPWRDWTFATADSPPATALPPLHLVAASDDAFATPAAQERLAARLSGARILRHEVQPASLGLARIGHFGLFRQRCAGIWPTLLHLALVAQGNGASPPRS